MIKHSHALILFGTVIAAATISVATGFANFTEPPSGTTPPGNNAEPPINVSGTRQNKIGSLGVSQTDPPNIGNAFEANGFYITNDDSGGVVGTGERDLWVGGSLKLEPYSLDSTPVSLISKNTELLDSRLDPDEPSHDALPTQKAVAVYVQDYVANNGATYNGGNGISVSDNTISFVGDANGGVVEGNNRLIWDSGKLKIGSDILDGSSTGQSKAGALTVNNSLTAESLFVNSSATIDGSLTLNSDSTINGTFTGTDFCLEDGTCLSDMANNNNGSPDVRDYIYVAGDDAKVRKIETDKSSPNEVWTFDLPNEEPITDVKTDNQGNIYVTQGEKLYKVDHEGNQMWTFERSGYRFEEIVVHPDTGRIFSLGDYNYQPELMMIASTGNEFADDATPSDAIGLDAEGNVWSAYSYADSSGSYEAKSEYQLISNAAIESASPTSFPPLNFIGENNIWVHTDYLKGDPEGHIYAGGYRRWNKPPYYADATLKGFNSAGNSVGGTYDEDKSVRNFAIPNEDLQLQSSILSYDYDEDLVVDDQNNLYRVLSGGDEIRKINDKGEKIWTFSLEGGVKVTEIIAYKSWIQEPNQQESNTNNATASEVDWNNPEEITSSSSPKKYAFCQIMENTQDTTQFSPNFTFGGDDSPTSLSRDEDGNWTVSNGSALCFPFKN